MCSFNARPERRNGGNGIHGPHQWTGQATEYGKVEGFQNAEEKKGAPATPSAHASVYFQHELNPRTEKEPVEDTGGPAVSKPLPSIRSFRHNEKQWGESERSEEAQIEFRENKQQQDRTKQT